MSEEITGIGAPVGAAVSVGVRGEVASLKARFHLAVGGSDRRGTGRFELSAEMALERGVLVVFGPSGSGKSLTLQAIAGLLRPRTGHIRVCGETVFDGDARRFVPPHRRRVGYVPQHHALFPFLPVWANVAFGLPRRERRADNPVVTSLMDELGLGHLADAHPERLSGGERQRVALARALAVRPRLLLLDEPFASIDVVGRRSLCTVLKNVLERHRTPAVFVTHDPVEAVTLADRVLLFDRGRSGQQGGPELLNPALEIVRAAVGVQSLV